MCGERSDNGRGVKRRSRRTMFQRLGELSDDELCSLAGTYFYELERLHLKNRQAWRGSRARELVTKLGAVAERICAMRCARAQGRE